MHTVIYHNDLIRVEIEESEVPWLKVFAVAKRKEFSDCSSEEKMMIFTALEIIEKEMLAYYRPEKINIASFGNYVPQVHWHIMARFKNDSYFPEPMWGKKQREGTVQLSSMDLFVERVSKKLAKLPLFEAE